MLKNNKTRVSGKLGSELSNPSYWIFLLLVTSIAVLNSCQIENPDSKSELNDNIKLDEGFRNTMTKHLNAVSNKDLKSLKETLSPNGNMELILPKREITNTVSNFMEMHEEWFQDTTWNFKTKILNTEIDQRIGSATVEVVYSEPDRNGKPYFNRMVVSYILERIENKWYVIKDHACSIEKTEN